MPPLQKAESSNPLHNPLTHHMLSRSPPFLLPSTASLATPPLSSAPRGDPAGFILAAKVSMVCIPLGLMCSVLLTTSGFVLQTRGLKTGNTVVVCTMAATSSMITGGRSWELAGMKMRGRPGWPRGAMQGGGWLGAGEAGRE